MAEKIKVLIVGSGGFIGSNLIRYMLKSSKNYSVVGIDRCDHPKVLNTIYSNPGAAFHIADATDKHITKTIFTLEQPDIVIQSISISNTQSSTIATETLLENAKTHNAKFVLLSDTKVYDNVQNASECTPVKKTHERCLEQMVESSGINYTIARLSNNIGPRQYDGIVPDAFKLLNNNKQATLNYNGSHIRSYIHVQDTCSAFLKILDCWKNNEIYNISTKQELSYIEVLQEMCNTMNAQYDIVKLNSNVEDYASLTASNDKIKSLGWVNSWKFKDSISQCCAWYKHNAWFL